MKFIELKENQPLKTIKVINHTRYQALPDPNTNKIEKEYIEAEDIRLYTIILTDGEIEKESEEKAQNIDEYYIGKKKYKHYVDTLKTKNIYFKNYSYVITYLIAKEWNTTGYVKGWYDFIKEVSIYLENKKDKKALKCAKQAIVEISNRSYSMNCSCLLGMIFPQENEKSKFKTKHISGNVYSLKK